MLRPLVMERAAEERGNIFKELFTRRLTSSAPLTEETLQTILGGEEDL